jgi:hypothetical protein
MELDYECARASKKLHVAISVLDQHDRMLFALDNHFVGTSLEASGAGTLRCSIPALALSPGTYRLNLWASLGGTVADLVQHAAEFHIDPADFFGTGRLPDHPKFGPFLVRHRWDHE